MKVIEWDDSFSVGDDDIDRQHKRWIALFNNAHDIMMNGSYEELTNLGRKALDEMVAYGKDHFAFEEAYMKENGFHDLARHSEIHRNFMRKMDELMLALHSGEHVLNSEILKFIENWLKDHILVEDQKIISS